MISFSADAAGIRTSPSAWGPSARPASRKTATSGILIFCATKAASVPTARISPHDSSVCWAIAAEEAASIRDLVQPLQPACDLSHRDIGLVEQPAHGKEAVELAGEVFVGDGHAGLLQPRGIFVALVAQRIGARGQHISRRQAGQRFDARWRGAPVV